MLLLVAAALTLATGDWTDMTVIVLVITVNTTVGVSQETRADRAISDLSGLTAPSARVFRDGIQYQIPAAEVVVGDVLVLAEGDILPADATVTEAASMLVNESAVTSKSLPVGKISVYGSRPGEPPPRTFRCRRAQRWSRAAAGWSSSRPERRARPDRSRPCSPKAPASHRCSHT